MLVKSVDKTSVTFEDTFNYTLNVSFNGITGQINSAKITDFIPDYLYYSLPSSIPYVQNITEESVDGGTLITFDFASISDLGISITINMDCNFILGTDSGTSFANVIELYINDLLYESSTAETVVLDVVEDFIIEKDIPTPNNRIGTPGGRVIFSIILKNRLKSQGGNGDPGAKINNIHITDSVPSWLILDPNYPVVGLDISSPNFADTRYDNLEATIVGNDITLDLPDYYGTDYRLVFVCTVDANITTSQLINTVNLSIDGVNRGNASTTLNIGASNYIGNIIKYGPNYGDAGDSTVFDIFTGNYGNIDLLNFIIEDLIPDEVTVTKINTGNFMLDVLNIEIPMTYTIEYLINNTEPYISLGSFNTAVAEYVTLPSVNVGEKITKIRWLIPNMVVGMISNQKISIEGVINSSTSSTFTNIGQIIYDDDTGTNMVQATHLTTIDPKSELNLKKGRVTNKSSFVPGDIIRYYLLFTGIGSQVNNPVVSDLLPEDLEYIGNEKYIFYDYFSDTTIDSTDSNFFNIVPITKEVEQNYNNTLSTLVTYNLDNFSLQQKGEFTIEFDTKVKPGAIGNISNFGVIGNIGDNGIVGAGQIPYEDVDDRDKDGITSETIVKSNTTTSTIIYTNALASDKKVKGALDTEFTEEPNIGLTYEGGSVDYKLTISNVGNLPYSYIEVVDILPHINDTGVISTNSARLSQFPVYLNDTISAYIVENNSILSTADVLVEYSLDYDPVRFSSSNFGDDTIGSVNDWSSTLPSNITSVKSLKIIMDNYLLQPNQSLVIHLFCEAPMGVEDNLVAWNSIAIKGRFLDENNHTQKILPVEPEKVGVKVLPSIKGSISGQTWMDSNKNGNIDAGEELLNGIVVRLLSSNMTVLDETVTTNDFNNNPGYYIFNNLDLGDYYIQFVAPTNLYFTLQDSATQNKADSSTGLTDKYTITNTTLNITGIDGGFIQGLDLLILLIDLLNDSIYSLDCSSTDTISQQVQNNTTSLINIVTLIIEFYQSILLAPETTDTGYKAQIQRLLDYLNNALVILNSLSVQNNYCNQNVLPYIIFSQVEFILVLINLLEINKGLNAYNDCSCLKTNLFNILIGDFINNITVLNSLLYDFYNLVLSLNTINNSMTNNYVASYVPPSKIIPIPIIQNRNHACPPVSSYRTCNISSNNSIIPCSMCNRIKK